MWESMNIWYRLCNKLHLHTALQSESSQDGNITIKTLKKAKDLVRPVVKTTGNNKLELV